MKETIRRRLLQDLKRGDTLQDAWMQVELVYLANKLAPFLRENPYPEVVTLQRVQDVIHYLESLP